MATWAEIAGVELSPEQAPDSGSFLPVLKDSTSTCRETLVTRGTRTDAFRDGDWKLILGPGSGSSGMFYSEPRSEDAWKAAIDAFGRKPKNHNELHSIHPSVAEKTYDGRPRPSIARYSSK